MNYDPDEPLTPDLLDAIRALSGCPPEPPEPPRPEPDIFATPDQRIEFHVARVAAALESLAAGLALNHRDSVRGAGCCRGCHR